MSKKTNRPKTSMSLFHCFLGCSPSDAHNSSNPLCNLHFKEGPAKVILEALLLDLGQQVKARKTCRSLEFEICLQKKSVQRLCWWKNVKVFAKEMTNSIKYHKIESQGAMQWVSTRHTNGTEQSGANKMFLHPVIWNKVLADY